VFHWAAALAGRSGAATISSFFKVVLRLNLFDGETDLPFSINWTGEHRVY
jgi:hypothetical protein